MAKRMPAAGRPARTAGAAVPARAPGSLRGSMRARANADVTWNATGRAAPPLAPREVIHVKRGAGDGDAG